MSKLLKYQRRNQAKKSLFTLDRTLLMGFVGLTGFGLAQPAVMSFAFNDTTPATTMTAQTKPPVIAAKTPTDLTPVGSIERKPVEADKAPATPAPNPNGLRLTR